MRVLTVAKRVRQLQILEQGSGLPQDEEFIQERREKGRGRGGEGEEEEENRGIHMEEALGPGLNSSVRDLEGQNCQTATEKWQHVAVITLGWQD